MKKQENKTRVTPPFLGYNADSNGYSCKRLITGRVNYKRTLFCNEDPVELKHPDENESWLMFHNKFIKGLIDT